MLEAERAGAKALVVFMDEHAAQRGVVEGSAECSGRRGAQLRADRRLLEKEGAAYSHATGEFYDKAVAVQGAHARIEYLVRGLKWAVKRFEEAVPTLTPEARDVFVKMRDSHLRSIAACERVLQALPR